MEVSPFVTALIGSSTPSGSIPDGGVADCNRRFVSGREAARTDSNSLLSRVLCANYEDGVVILFYLRFSL